MKNGAEKTIYMTVKQIEAHERKNRKGKDMGKGWKDDFDAMARKTIIRKLAGKYGLMSITYQNGSDAIVKLANEVLEEDFHGTENGDLELVQDYTVIDSTGEVVEVN